MKKISIKKPRMPKAPKLKMPKLTRASGPGFKRKKRLNVGKALST